MLPRTRALRAQPRSVGSLPVNLSTVIRVDRPAGFLIPTIHCCTVNAYVAFQAEARDAVEPGRESLHETSNDDDPILPSSMDARMNERSPDRPTRSPAAPRSQSMETRGDRRSASYGTARAHHSPERRTSPAVPRPRGGSIRMPGKKRVRDPANHDDRVFRTWSRSSPERRATSPAAPVSHDAPSG